MTKKNNIYLDILEIHIISVFHQQKKNCFVPLYIFPNVSEQPAHRPHKGWQKKRFDPKFDPLNDFFSLGM